MCATNFVGGGGYAHKRAAVRPSRAQGSNRASVRTQRAFTLLEMLAVILLIGIAAAAVSISVTRGIASARINAAAGELAASLRATRTQAVVHSEQRTFDLDIRNNSYRGADHRNVRLPIGLQLSITSATNDRVDGQTARIRFFPDGSSTGGRITLQSGQRQWHVNVSWLTGAVNIFDSSAPR